MKKLLSLILVLTLTLTFFASCGKTEQALTSTELLDLGEKYLLDLDYEQAIVYFNQVIEVEPRNSRAYIGAAEAYIGLGDTESAIDILKTALDVFTDDDNVTITVLEMLIEIDPTTAEWYIDLAQIYINQGNTDKAIEVLEDGLNNASDTADIEALLAELLPEEEPEVIEEETVEIEPAYESNFCVLDNDMIRNPTYFDKSTITEIDFLDSLDSVPSDAWDFSLDGDGSVLGWLDGTHLYVAGDGGVIADEDASELFYYSWEDDDGTHYGLESLIAINFNNCFDTSNVVNMSRMFSHCKSITNIDFSGFDTSLVTNMKYMFSLCESLTELDLSEFDTSRVINMTYMFCQCSSLAFVDVSNFDTSSVTNMSMMFGACGSLPYLDIGNFDTSNVIDMDGMFYNCEALTSLDLDNFITSNVTNMNNMFSGCTSLTYLNLSSFDTSNVADMNSMFWRCESLTTLDLSNFDTSNVTDMWGMFYKCSSLTSLDISNFDTTNANTAAMFKYTIFE